jgi:hypothetical protein
VFVRAVLSVVVVMPLLIVAAVIVSATATARKCAIRGRNENDCGGKRGEDVGR